MGATENAGFNANCTTESWARFCHKAAEIIAKLQPVYSLVCDIELTHVNFSTFAMADPRYGMSHAIRRENMTNCRHIVIQYVVLPHLEQLVNSRTVAVVRLEFSTGNAESRYSRPRSVVRLSL